MSESPESQAQLRFRPEIQAAFSNDYGAYTRFSDETDQSLALFLALPLESEGELIGSIYVSHTTDEILQQLGVIRRSTTRLLIVLAGISFLGILLLTGRLQSSLKRLRNLTSNVGKFDGEDIEVEGNDQVAEIGQNFNRLIASLRQKVAELEEEKTKTKHFVEDVAHELKTPLTGLAGSVEALMSEDMEEADRARLLGNVEKETARLAELTSRLLELQKLEHSELRVESFDLVSVAETVVDSYQASARKRGLSLAIEGTDTLTAQGDMKKIQRVLENLVDNALRCSPKGESVVIRLSAAEERALLQVEDKGPGPPDPGLFDRNVQGAKFPGSMGLGLSIAVEILRLHESELKVEPGAEAGSVFSFELNQPTQN